ncbi:hypothetical protein LTS17_000014 [Exophiala oligosperma]
MSSQESEPNHKRRRTNAAAPHGQRQGRDTPQERQQESGSGDGQQQLLGRQQPAGTSATPAPVQRPLAGTFAGPAGRWRQYTQREVDAYHGLLMLRYGPIVDFQRRGNPTQLTMSSPSHLPVAVGSGITSENRASKSTDDGTVVTTATSSNTNAATTTTMGPPPRPTTVHPQQGGLTKTTQPNHESQGKGKGKGKRKPKPPAKRYSCYHCHYTALGVTYVCRHLQNKHGVAPDQVDVARIRASEVQCLW